jgi:uncharacterized protein DUF3857
MAASGYTQAFTVVPDSGSRGPGNSEEAELAVAATSAACPPGVRRSRLQQILLADTIVEPTFTPGEMAMFRLGKWVVLGLAVWMLAAQEAKAGIGFQPVSPDELKLTSEPQAPGAPAIILYRQVDRDDNGHTSHEDNYVRIKILTEEGRKYANVEIPFLKGSQSIVNVKARTIMADGSTADFGGQVFEKYLVKGKGIKYLAKTFTLPDVQVGSIIGFGSYHSKTEASGQMLHYTRALEVKELSVPLSKMDELKKFYRMIAADERNTAVLKPAGAGK